MTTPDTGKLFGRGVTLSVTNLSSTPNIVGPGLPNTLITPAGLRVTFKVTKGTKSKQNKASISVYNLSSFNRSSVIAPAERGGTPKLQVVLTVGYGLIQNVLFLGQGTAKTEWEPPNHVTTFTVADGSPALNSSFVNKAYPIGTPIDFIISDIALILLRSGIVVGPYPLLGTALKRARSFSGSAARVMDDLGSKYGFEFDVQDSIGLIRTSGVPASLTSLPVVLSQYTGLVGQPYTDGKIVRAQCLINPLIKPGSLVTLAVADPTLAGVYKTKKVVAAGDNYGDDWTMKIEMAAVTTKEGYTTLSQVETSILTGGAL